MRRPAPTEAQRYRSNVVDGFIRQKLAATEVAVQTSRPPSLRRKKAGCAVAVVHLADIRGTGHDVVVLTRRDRCLGCSAGADRPNVSGMICISPMAAAEKTACSWPSDS